MLLWHYFHVKLKSVQTRMKSLENLCHWCIRHWTAGLAGTKESAFIYSITSAAITHTITRACSSSNMTTCTCAKVGNRRRRREEANMEPWPYDWQWGGCSDNIKYGKRFSEQFVDALDDALDTNNSMIQLHNNKVGRKVRRCSCCIHSFINELAQFGTLILQCATSIDVTAW